MSIRADLERTAAPYWRGDRVSFRPIATEEDLAWALFVCRLTGEQEDLVNPPAFSIGRAYLFPEDNCPCLICDEQGEAIGFINLCRWLGEGDACSWSFLIDRDRQGKGYGRSAARLAVRLLQAACPGKALKLAAEEANEKAQRLYRSLGFRLLDERDGDDLVFER